MEEFLQIEIDDPSMTARNMVLRRGHRLLCRPARPKAVAKSENWTCESIACG
jgi:hypothetical protein